MHFIVADVVSPDIYIVLWCISRVDSVVYVHTAKYGANRDSRDSRDVINRKYARDGVIFHEPNYDGTRISRTGVVLYIQ